MFCDKQKKSSTFSLAFLRTVFLPVCEFHSVWAVLLVILNEVEVCPLFAALRVFCHAQDICNMHVACCAATQRCNLRCFALLPRIFGT